MELFELIKRGEYDFSAPEWEQVSLEGRDFVQNLLVVNPEKRMASDEIK